MLNNKEISLLKENLGFWEKLSASQKDILTGHATVVRYEKNSAVHMAQLECVGLLLPKSGSLRVYMLSEEGKEITLYRVSAGDVCILSAACVLKTITFDVSIDAISDCELILIDSAAFSSLMKENIYVEAYAYKLATERFSDVMWAMQQILFMSFDRRLAVFLLDETAKAGTETLKMTQEEVARYMGSAREVVSRMLKYFSSEGLVQIARGEIRICDRKKLMEVLNTGGINHEKH